MEMKLRIVNRLDNTVVTVYDLDQVLKIK